MTMKTTKKITRSTAGLRDVSAQGGRRGWRVAGRDRQGASARKESGVTLPDDIARCPGKALIQGAHIVTDPYCTGCKRLQAGIEDRAQWVADGRPRIDGGAPAMRVPWMVAPVEMPCNKRIES